MLLRMSEEDQDYEGKWPGKDAMTKPTVDDVMKLAHDLRWTPRDPAKVQAATASLRAALESLIAAPAAPQQSEPVSAFQRSAPERIWLNVGDISDEDRFEDVSNDGCEWICWCEDSQDKNDVPYVRADLAHPPAAEVQAEPVQPVQAQPEIDSSRCSDALYTAGKFSPRTCAICGLGPCRRFSQPTAKAQPEPVGALQGKTCHYMAFPDQVCNKCGKVHGYSRAGGVSMYTIENRAGVDVLVMGKGAQPATEAESAFYAEVVRLRADVEALRADAERKRIELENMGDTVTSLRSEVALYRGESEKLRDLLNYVPLPPVAITYERGWKLIDMLQAAAIDAARAAQGER